MKSCAALSACWFFPGTLSRLTSTLVSMKTARCLAMRCAHSDSEQRVHLGELGGSRDIIHKLAV